MLKQYWIRLMNTQAFEHHLETYDFLIKHYSEKSRAYHNLDHIQDCLEKFNKVKHLFKNPNAVEIAIWFHDVVYNAYRKDNELKSAIAASDFLTKQNANEDFTKIVFDLIMITLHTNTPQSDDEALMMDIDVSILGSSPEIYDAYCQKIRKEYSWVPGFVYRKKRKEVLNLFLKKRFIYQTEYFRLLYENQARANIISEIDAL